MSIYGDSLNNDETFDVSSDTETTISEPQNEGANVCRLGALSTLLGADADTIFALSEPMETLGLAEGLTSGEVLWRSRSDSELNELSEYLRQIERLSRPEIWTAINQNLSPTSAIAFMVSALGSSLERESAAAAAALWQEFRGTDRYEVQPWFVEDHYLRNGLRYPNLLLWNWSWQFFGEFLDDFTLNETFINWDEVPWSYVSADMLRLVSSLNDAHEQIAVILNLSKFRLQIALRSSDSITRELATSAFISFGFEDRVAERTPQPLKVPSTELQVSTMVHGTRAWMGEWWEPEGDFHEYISLNYRSNLYKKGAPFSWDGRLSESHRVRAGIRLMKWASSEASNGMETVFGHSYGGEVLARSVLDGANVSEMVLLSAPITESIRAAIPHISTVIDIRLTFDPILALARGKQHVPDEFNVTRIFLSGWRLNHGATHDKNLWINERIADQCGW